MKPVLIAAALALLGLTRLAAAEEAVIRTMGTPDAAEWRFCCRTAG
jgi:hypothetical protein